ncbi:IS200/IS605 family transposase [Patescibacteria group bacterium]|nr:IS200/IS605 family transposase [Patescibacteria group bacterium]
MRMLNRFLIFIGLSSQNRLLSLRSYHRVLGIDFEVSAMDRQGKELRYDRYTVSLLTDHLVITPNIDHVHIFFQYPPKYSLVYIAKKIKGRSSRILREEFPHLRDWCEGHLWSLGCYHGSVGQGWEVVEKYISSQNCVGGEKDL